MLPKPLEVKGARDAGGSIWHDGSFHRDAWVRPVADAPLPDAPVLLTKARWLAQREALLGRGGPLGLLLAPGEALADVADDIHRLALVALAFPKFSDGRAFSMARLLREKHRFQGELRAVGHVLNDQIALMWRVGFTSLEVTHGPTRKALETGRLAALTLYYQPAVLAEPAAGTRPWLRQAAFTRNQALPERLP